MISMVVESQGVPTCWSSGLAVWADSDPFHGLLLTVLWSQIDFHGCRTPRCAYMLVINTHSLGRFWPVSWTITRFWGPGVISTINEPRGALTCRSSHSRFWPILAHFMDYYSPFWRPKSISMVVEPQGAHTCRSSTLTVWAYSGQFLGL